MASSHRLAVHWFRRDLRILDNSALHAAGAGASCVLPVYLASDWKEEHPWTGPKRQAFLCRSLASLAGNLETLGGRLVVRSGVADEALEKLIVESGADALYFNRDPDPFGRAMEAKVEAMARRLGIACYGFHDVTLHDPGEVLTQDGKPYRVYTPYSRNWLALEKPLPLPKPLPRPRARGPRSLPRPVPRLRARPAMQPYTARPRPAAAAGGGRGAVSPGPRPLPRLQARLRRKPGKAAATFRTWRRRDGGDGAERCGGTEALRLLQLMLFLSSLPCDH
jgi:deoxyribodipyrimidine photo-lyase